MNKKMVITTTSTLEGWDIESYLGVISSHVVAGTGVIADTFAGLSDFFGGRSKSYQNQLMSINDEAISILVEQVEKKSGNGIIGLKLDHDEISGKGKTMFMVTATATAVKIKRSSGNNNFDDAKRSTYISSTELQLEIRKNNILTSIKSGDSQLNDESWDFIIKNQVLEAAPYVLDTFQHIKTSAIMEDAKKKYIDLCTEYLINLNPEDQIEILYTAVETHLSIFDLIAKIINDIFAFDFTKVQLLLDHEDIQFQKKGLILAQAGKSNYSIEDLDLIKTLITKIEQTFTIQADFIEVKSKIGSKTKKMWKCTCETNNNEDQTYCSSCKKDIRGFKKDEVKPDFVLSLLQQKLSILEELLK